MQDTIEVEEKCEPINPRLMQILKEDLVYIPCYRRSFTDCYLEIDGVSIINKSYNEQLRLLKKNGLIRNAKQVTIELIVLASFSSSLYDVIIPKGAILIDTYECDLNYYVFDVFGTKIKISFYGDIFDTDN